MMKNLIRQQVDSEKVIKVGSIISIRSGTRYKESNNHPQRLLLVSYRCELELNKSAQGS